MIGVIHNGFSHNTGNMEVSILVDQEIIFYENYLLINAGCKAACKGDKAVFCENSLLISAGCKAACKGDKAVFCENFIPINAGCEAACHIRLNRPSY